MKHITLTDSEGATLKGQLPEGWHEVPLSAFLEFQQQQEGKPEAMAALTACATLTSLPTEALEADVSLAALILPHMGFLNALPQAEPLLVFKHEGTTYEHVGNLQKVSTDQFEALLNFLQAAEGNPIQAAPNLLAVLYKPRGKAQDAETVQATAKAFHSLPMDKAWGALAFFLTSSQPAAQTIRSYFHARKTTDQALTTLEALTDRPSRTRSWRIVARLVRAYTRSARAQLRKS